jgi:opacity protein-like surface antigen
MLKYTLPSWRSSGRVRPFLEVGPSFRTQEDASAVEPSQFGISAGIGAAFHLGPFRLAPSLRYTRWARESIYPRYATKPDQVELLTAISYATAPSAWRVKGRKIRLGVVAGTPFTGGLDHGPDAMPFVSELRGYMAGLAVDFELTRRLSVEVNGIYRPYRGFGLGYALDGRLTSEQEFTVLTWQFPVLAKLNLRPSSRFQPILEAGPSFRLSGNNNGYNPARIGFTVGAGVETKVGRLAIGPVVRYTRWAQDTNLHDHPAGRYGTPHTSQDQVELLVKFFF